jgi:NAD(P)-dependent dehydrogenase (short-subunit alcohol dehydrogenase family)
MMAEQRVAVITGAASGIGRATALRLAPQVQTLLLLDTDAQKLAALQVQLAGQSGTADIETGVGEVTQEIVVQEAFARIQAQHGRLDILVNNVGGSTAAGNPATAIEGMELAQWQALLTLNLTSLFLCCRAALPLMKLHRYGRIVNLSSVASRGRRDKVSVAYAASKAGVDGFTRKLAREAAPYGITCNAVAPGITLTERVSEKFWDVRSAEEQQSVLESIPLGRLSTAEEQAEVVAFLASAAASYLTGQIIDVSGGI